MSRRPGADLKVALTPIQEENREWDEHCACW
jgi:hypothetical protein